MSKKADIETTAEAYLELLAARGVEYFFGNAGTDFARINEAYARRGAHGQLLPRPITDPHEVPAVAIAHGYSMVTGRPQAVMVHVIVGTANAQATWWPRARRWRKRRGSSRQRRIPSSSPRPSGATRARSRRW